MGNGRTCMCIAKHTKSIHALYELRESSEILITTHCLVCSAILKVFIPWLFTKKTCMFVASESCACKCFFCVHWYIYMYMYTSIGL